jgi:phospholipase C
MNGTNGTDGTNGTNGTNGADGGQGPQGPAGVDGGVGPQGPQGPPGTSGSGGDEAASFPTTTKIKHLVVIFQENVSFDKYFGTYPVAANLAGETPFPTVVVPSTTPNTLSTPLDPNNSFAAISGIDLLNSNPNNVGDGGLINGINATNPFRIAPSEQAIASQTHSYTPEQLAFDDGLMDLFPTWTGFANNVTPPQDANPPFNTKGLVMGYYDGNTVTALWNYAQHYTLNDNSYGTSFGPSAIGAINLVSGQTNAIISSNAAAASGGGTNLDNDVTPDGDGGASLTDDAQPLGDSCSSRDAVQIGGGNVGDLLNDAGVSWGFFQGGFDLTLTNANGTTSCKRSSVSPWQQVPKVDYIPHHQPFQYYATTQNLNHSRPSSLQAIGKSFESDGTTAEPANHQYDIHDFVDAMKAGNMPAVSYLKAPGYQDGHAGYSSPLDEQTFVVNLVNMIEQSPFWNTTAIIILYDDSDGAYDHQQSPVVNPSTITGATALAGVSMNGVTVAGNADELNGDGLCTSSLVQQGVVTPAVPLNGSAGYPAQGRCGYGMRQPLIVISPFAKANYIDHTLTDQTSVLRLIEDNWLNKQRIAGSFDALAGDLTGANSALDFTLTTGPLYLDPSTGQLMDCPTCL